LYKIHQGQSFTMWLWNIRTERCFVKTRRIR